MLIPRAVAGFTLVELLVAVTIAGVLLALGLPAMTGYMNAAKVGSAAQTLHSGLQMARTEAIRRNVPVQFLLTNAAMASGVANAAVPDINGRNWLVRASDASAGGWALVDGRAAAEGGALQVTLAPTASAVTFNGFGGTTTGAGLSVVLSHTSSGCAATDPIRCKTVRASPGGQVTTCDPAVTDTTDSRFCTP